MFKMNCYVYLKIRIITSLTIIYNLRKEIILQRYQNKSITLYIYTSFSVRFILLQVLQVILKNPRIGVSARSKIRDETVLIYVQLYLYLYHYEYEKVRVVIIAFYYIMLLCVQQNDRHYNILLFSTCFTENRLRHRQI